MNEIPLYLEKLQTTEAQRQVPLTVCTSKEQIVCETGKPLLENCEAIAQWIQTRANMTHDMLTKPAEELELLIQEGRAVVILEPDINGVKNIVGFCALTMTHPEGGEPLAWELGAMIKGDTSEKHIGLLLLVETLKLPKALELDAVIAYCNKTSYHIMVENGGGVEVTDAEFLAQYNLVPWEGDRIVDLTFMRDQIYIQTRRSIYAS